VQVATFEDQDDAERTAARLAKRGQSAQVIPAKAGFRLLVGRYATRKEADAAKAKLKKQGQSGFVVELPK
jgi:cell division protein FtsN